MTFLRGIPIELLGFKRGLTCLAFVLLVPRVIQTEGTTFSA